MTQTHGQKVDGKRASGRTEPSGQAVTCVLQLGGVLLHLVLRASVGDGDHHLGNVSSHSILHGEGLLVGVFERHSCSTEGNCVRRATGWPSLDGGGERSNLSWCFLLGSGRGEEQPW